MLGMQIARLRSGKGWSQAELARRIKVSASAVGMYEQGRREPSLDLLVRLAQELGVSTDYLLMGENICSDSFQGQQTSSVTIWCLTHAIIQLIASTIVRAGDVLL